MRRSGVVMTLAGYGAVLVALRPEWSHWPPQGLWAFASNDPEGALVNATSLLGWGLAAWLFAVAALSLAAQTPSAAGRLAACFARRLTPRLVRRALETALGVSLALGPAGAALAGGSPALAPVPAPVVAAAEFSFPDLDRPMVMASSQPTQAPSATPSATPASPAPIPKLSPPDIPEPAPVAAPSPAQPAAHYTVVPGDTLWGLASQAAPEASPAQITALWQQWYTVNRATIGADPGLLLPGQMLSVPAATS